MPDFGNPAYMAPELLAGQGDYNEKVDIWSIGVILFVLLAGRPPFDGRNGEEVSRKVKIGSYNLNTPEWAYVSSDAIDLLRKMLAYDPNKRVSAKDAIKHRWI